MQEEQTPTRERILESLGRGGGKGWVSGEALSREFHISRAAVSKHVCSLREEGNIIESVPRRGYRLLSRADPWAGDDARGPLHTNMLGQSSWIWLKETGSTNQVAALQALSGAPEGVVVVARRQSEGRGSRGSRWLCLPGSLSFSVITRPALAPEELALLPALAMEACVRAVEKSCGVRLEKRAPNDLFLNGGKVAGILVESMFHNTELRWAVVGIGVNVNAPHSAIPPELQGTATSLYAETGEAFSVTKLLRHILEELEEELERGEKIPRRD
ncbi:biotin--[acetyl-CoA-carboxylase] ligase [Mailhella massiliensis]|uniref:Biotin--[acetyl-CoA-carboxylase] ligase n=1 Tax=Mailhella massiliensis TaxID=1903261 RepID=A0A921AY05_9BACT|nr:biotin--[acetyl-CoA-carboxylase] ligase [Mailhella massiliensis]HJD97949.1 biotin--[acetyl-CoA-carboxylase] ligase [Mailhella massiliensis]